MHLRKTLFTLLVAGLFVLMVPLTSEWIGVGQAQAKTSSRIGKQGAESRRKGKRGRKQVLRGHGVRSTRLRTEPLEKPSGNLWIANENLKEELRINLYDEQGDFDQEALAQLDHIFRCRRTHEQRAVDPRLFEMLSRIQDHFDGKRVTLVSGFRFQRNEGSRHYHASAMDIRIPGVGIKKLRAFADSLDKGGMGIGIYPTSGFVHVDFRAPGQPSYRWVDRNGPDRGTNKGKRRSRRAVRRRAPNS